MITEYVEIGQQVGAKEALWIVLFGIYPHRHRAETIRITTPHVPSLKAVEIASQGMGKYKRAAFEYMHVRRELDGERDREIMREHGGTNCKVCGTFFMPSADKIWTQSDCCSRVCYAKTGAATIADTKRKPEKQAPEARLTGQAVVNCPCGHQFEVSSMYVGTPRPCPQCGAKTIVS
jgi:hypothetical protein